MRRWPVILILLLLILLFLKKDDLLRLWGQLGSATTTPQPSASLRKGRGSPEAPTRKSLNPIVENLLKEHRHDIAQCVLKEKTLNVGKMEMTLVWNGAGTLQSIALKPEPNPAVRDCLWTLIAEWRIGIHSGLQPLSYTTHLVFSGN